MSKFIFKSEIKPNQNPAYNMKVTTIRAKRENNLITINDLNKFVQKFEDEDIDVDDMKIIVCNKERRYWTIKSNGEEYDNRYKGTENENNEKLNEFYEILFISKP